jgi:hypothetical protein
MHFDEQKLKSYSEPLTEGELEEGTVYFDAGFLDWQMLTPYLQPYVFIGRNLDPDNEYPLFFQDYESFSLGVRLATATVVNLATFVLDSAANLHFYSYESSLNQLMVCSLRRRGISERTSPSFEARDLEPNPEPIPDGAFREGSVYFFVTFGDEDRLIPTLEPYVFLGRDLKPEDPGRLYFQDFSSHRKDARDEKTTQADDASIWSLMPNEANSFFEYEPALEELMRCWLRRRAVGLVAPERAEPENEPPQEPAQDEQPKSLRFDDAGLQERFIAELRMSALPFEVRSDGAVVCAAKDWASVKDVAAKFRGGSSLVSLVLYVLEEVQFCVPVLAGNQGSRHTSSGGTSRGRDDLSFAEGERGTAPRHRSTRPTI